MPSESRKPFRDALAAASAPQPRAGQFMLPQGGGQRLRVLRIFFDGFPVLCIRCMIPEKFLCAGRWPLS